MKKIAPALAVLLFILPSVSSAAALTQQQSTSLIAVVQSSPGTPASAFVSLITAFSSITVPQATSLITVVQSAPGTPANAFVNLLTSFTVDTPTIQPAVQEVTSTPTTESVIPQSSNVVPSTPTTTSATPSSVTSTSAQTPTPTPTVAPQITREPYQATSPVKVGVPNAIGIEINNREGDGNGNYKGHYKFKNNTNALGIIYSTAVVKVWREYEYPVKPAKDVSVEIYSESGLTSKAGYWGDGGLIKGEYPFTLNSAIGDTEATALVVEVPINLYLPSREHNLRIEVHPDNGQSSYRGVLVELR